MTCTWRTPCMSRMNGAGLAPSVPELNLAEIAPCPYCATRGAEYLRGHKAIPLRPSKHCRSWAHHAGWKAAQWGHSQDQVAVALHDQVGVPVRRVEGGVLERCSSTQPVSAVSGSMKALCIHTAWRLHARHWGHKAVGRTGQVTGQAAYGLSSAAQRTWGSSWLA